MYYGYGSSKNILWKVKKNYKEVKNIFEGKKIFYGSSKNILSYVIKEPCAEFCHCYKVHPRSYDAKDSHSHILEQVLATTCQWHDAVLTISWPEVWCVAVCWHLHCPELHPGRNWAEPLARQSPVCQGSGPGTLTTTAPARPGHGTGDWE